MKKKNSHLNRVKRRMNMTLLEWNYDVVLSLFADVLTRWSSVTVALQLWKTPKSPELKEWANKMTRNKSKALICDHYGLVSHWRINLWSECCLLIVMNITVWCINAICTADLNLFIYLFPTCTASNKDQKVKAMKTLRDYLYENLISLVSFPTLGWRSTRVIIWRAGNETQNSSFLTNRN